MASVLDLWWPRLDHDGPQLLRRTAQGGVCDALRKLAVAQLRHRRPVFGATSLQLQPSTRMPRMTCPVNRTDHTEEDKHSIDAQITSKQM